MFCGLFLFFVIRKQPTEMFNDVMTFFATEPGRESLEMFSRITSEIR